MLFRNKNLEEPTQIFHKTSRAEPKRKEIAKIHRGIINEYLKNYLATKIFPYKGHFSIELFAI